MRACQLQQLIIYFANIDYSRRPCINVAVILDWRAVRGIPGTHHGSRNNAVRTRTPYKYTCTIDTLQQAVQVSKQSFEAITQRSSAKRLSYVEGRQHAGISQKHQRFDLRNVFALRFAEAIVEEELGGSIGDMVW